MNDGTAMSRENSVNGDGEWSSAVGRASVAGKSGRVIERLMGDVDKLKRELNLAQARVEEEQLRGVSAREALDSLRGTKENLEAICETNQNIIARRDRKIEELKAELDAERERRVEAEKGRTDLTIAIQNLKVNTEKEVSRATEIASRSQTEYDAFRKAFLRMKADSEKQLSQMRKELNVVHSDRDDEVSKLKTLTKISKEFQAESMKALDTNQRTIKTYEEYKELRDSSIQEMVSQIRNGDAANEELYTEMAETLGRMRWVMNIKQDVPSIRQKDDPEPSEPEAKKLEARKPEAKKSEQKKPDPKKKSKK